MNKELIKKYKNEFEKIVGPHRDNSTIEFTGIVSQREVAEITAKASYFIYPAALPETYGISTLESLYYNTPLLTCKFGALEETASEHSYYIDYPVVPNGLFPNINSDKQTHKFVDMVSRLGCCCIRMETTSLFESGIIY